MSVVSMFLSSYFRKKFECVSIHTKYNNLKIISDLHFVLMLYTVEEKNHHKLSLYFS